MRRDTLNLLTLAGFGLILLSFLVRGLGQFVVGPRRVLRYAGPIAVLAAVVLFVAVAVWTADRVGFVSLENGEG